MSQHQLEPVSDIVRRVNRRLAAIMAFAFAPAEGIWVWAYSLAWGRQSPGR